MKKKIMKYLALTRAGIVEELQFRMGIFVRVLGNLIYLIIVYFLWKAIFDSSPSDVVNGMTFSSTMIYLVLAAALYSSMEMYVTWMVGRSVQNGNIVLDILKPIRYDSYTFWRNTGNTLVSVILILIPTMVIVYVVTKGGFALSWNLLYFSIAILFGTIINYYINFMVGNICFFTESIWGVNIMKEVVVMLLSGASIPLAFFPEGLRQIVYHLPFQAIYNTPLTLLIDQSLSTQARIEMLSVQFVWVIVLILMSKFFLHFSIRRITVNGG
ncbi:MAG: hypothetical protein GX567_13655 [Clostridia bacterium]|nr:hypothetical protein [Clostridia bacterium]